MESILNILLHIGAILAVFIFFSVTVFIHEFGHFLAARMCGMKVETFSIGFGPTIWKKKINGITYKLSWILFGGYVALPQLDPEGMELIQGTNENEKAAIPYAPWWKKIVVSFAGPFGNILFAIVLALIISIVPRPDVIPGLDINGAVVGDVEKNSDAETSGFMVGDEALSVFDEKIETWDGFVTECHIASGGKDCEMPVVVSNHISGVVRTINANVTRLKGEDFYMVHGLSPAMITGVSEVAPGSPAEKAGLKKDDIFLSANGIPVLTYLSKIINNTDGKEIEFELLRGKDTIKTVIKPEWTTDKLEDGDEYSRWAIGIITGYIETTPRSWTIHRNPWKQLKSDALQIVRVLRPLFAQKHKGEAKQVAGAIGGPVMILTHMYFTILASLFSALAFLRLLNVNLAVINLLPIPVLDGGHIVFGLWEGITRRRVNAKFVNYVSNFFASLLIVLFVILLFKDSRLIYKHFVKKGPQVEDIKDTDDAVVTQENDNGTMQESAAE